MKVGKEFLGLFERCDRLANFWSKWQAALLFIFYPIWPFIFLLPDEHKKWGFYIWVIHATILLLPALVGFFKVKSLLWTFNKLMKLISRHPNKTLVMIFRKVPRVLVTILVLELFLPLTWIASFPFKFLFHKNISQIKTLIVDRRNLD